MKPILLLILMLIASSCSLFKSEPETNIYEGMIVLGFEEMKFTDMGNTERWWISGMPEGLQERYNELATREYDAVYIKFRGKAGPKEQYGHLGQYAREVEIIEVIEMRKMQ